MLRREFLSLAAAPIAAAEAPLGLLDQYFRTIYDGFLRNARRTSSSFAVCDFEGGAKLPGALATSGKTYDSVTRMMPALAAWQVSGRGNAASLQVLRSMFVNAFDPKHPDYWGASDPKRQHQKQVESSIVAWSLWLLRDQLLPQLTSEQRSNINAWLASCTQVPVRSNNWAWFTAVNQAVRLDLNSRWSEFQGDAKWMEQDVRFLDTLAAPGPDGWYTDSLNGPVYDYYNFWVFGSHFLYWNRVIGDRYPELRKRFADRLNSFLLHTPNFFGANGSHVLYGRSLIYRWAELTPLVLAYTQKLWPHSPGVLLGIVRRNVDYLWNIGAYDEARGKLRETYTPEGTPAIKESYIDNGHPYWGMQAFAFFLIPDRDPFWTAKEELLPVERGDFRVRFEGTNMLLTGTKRTGEVRWYQSSTSEHYPDKYAKLGYSSHFPFGISKVADGASVDQALLFVDPKRPGAGYRSHVSRSQLTPEGLAISWTAKLGDLEFQVETQIDMRGEQERRVHRITTSAAALEREIEVVEGSYGLPLRPTERPERETRGEWIILRSAAGVIAARMDNPGVMETDGENVIHKRTAIIVSRRRLTALTTALCSEVFASPIGNVSFSPAF